MVDAYPPDLKERIIHSYMVRVVAGTFKVRETLSPLTSLIFHLLEV